MDQLYADHVFLVGPISVLNNLTLVPLTGRNLDLRILPFLSATAPKGLFPPEPEHYRGPKLKVAIIGAGLAGMSTAVELLDQGHEVC